MNRRGLAVLLLVALGCSLAWWIHVDASASLLLTPRWVGALHDGTVTFFQVGRQCFLLVDVPRGVAVAGVPCE